MVYYILYMFEARLLRSLEEPPLELKRATSQPQKSLIPTAEEAYLRLVTTSLRHRHNVTYNS